MSSDPISNTTLSGASTGSASFVLRVYRAFLGGVIFKYIFPIFVSPSRMAPENQLQLNVEPRLSADGRRIWFHAASVGEFESLLPILEIFQSDRYELIVSVFSESAWGSLKYAEAQAAKTGRPWLATGYSPTEGGWESALQRFRPALFVTARYEAWPDLWMSLRRRGIPLVVLSAQARSSLRWAKRVCRLMGVGLPKLAFSALRPEDVSALQVEFPEAEVASQGDPRWDRVMARAQQGHPRASNIIRKAKRVAPRPWGILGSVWASDIEFWRRELKRDSGTLWIVPHRVGPLDIAALLGVLRALGIDEPIRTSAWVDGGQIEEFEKAREWPAEISESSENTPASSENADVSSRDAQAQTSEFPRNGVRIILVDEMGFLSELYSAADWAYVGGGFGSNGVHSTIEPAVQGIPVAVGPSKNDKFPEIEELRSTQQLRTLRERSDLTSWLEFAESAAPGHRENWILQVRARLGAGKRAAAWIRERIL